MQILRIISGLFILILPFSGSSQKKITVEEYIEMYKDMAVDEMKKYRIPASITLAQGILESSSGNNDLARYANNHFGIKCHKGWEGKTYHKDDDEKDECFRKYKDAEESYRDHSLFLTTRDRYKLLFDLEITDYKGWAHGLSKAGYATNPRYPELLIRIIEENKLDRFDTKQERQLAVGSWQPAVGSWQPEVGNLPPSVFPTDFELVGRGGNDRVIFKNNGVKFIFARQGDDIFRIASEFGIYAWQVRKYNDLGRKDKLQAGEKVYLEKKRSHAAVDVYIATGGETIREVAQAYGIRQNFLLRLNGRTNTPLSETEILYLNK